jgi:hypothetical protein
LRRVARENDEAESSPNDAGSFGHFFCRKTREIDAWGGYLLEVVASDGRRIRSLRARRSHIECRQYEHSGAASALVERIEGSAPVGGSFTGWSMLESADTIAALHVGSLDNPGWVAFSCDRDARRRRQTLPLSLQNDVTLQLVARADIRWQRRQLVAALSLERADGVASSLSPLEHVRTCHLRCASLESGHLETIDVCASSRGRHDDALRTISSQRVVREIALEPTIFQAARRRSATFWCEVTFERSLLCLPRAWRTFWCTVTLEDPPHG